MTKKNLLKENRVLLKSYIQPHEKEALIKHARHLNISCSELVSRLVNCRALPDAEKNRDLRDLVKINGDLARLGNLFKLAIDDGVFEANQYNEGTDIESLVTAIRARQSDLKTVIKDLAKS